MLTVLYNVFMCIYVSTVTNKAINFIHLAFVLLEISVVFA